MFFLLCCGMIKHKLKQAATLPYLGYVRNELEITNTRVKKWADWNPESDVYEAFYEQRSVIIPIPVCDWSFLVCLHEIGHISTGDRVFGYLREYNAEQWAIKKAKQSYNIVCDEYVEDAKVYVKGHLLANLIHDGLELEKIRPYVLDWLGESHTTLSQNLVELKAQQSC